jgi:hypothetical protein
MERRDGKTTPHRFYALRFLRGGDRLPRILAEMVMEVIFVLYLI